MCDNQIQTFIEHTGEKSVIGKIRDFINTTYSAVKKGEIDLLDVSHEDQLPTLDIPFALNVASGNLLQVRISSAYNGNIEVGFYLTEILDHAPDIKNLWLARIWATLVTGDCEEDSHVDKPQFNIHGGVDSRTYSSSSIRNKQEHDNALNDVSRSIATLILIQNILKLFSVELTDISGEAPLLAEFK